MRYTCLFLQSRNGLLGNKSDHRNEVFPPEAGGGVQGGQSALLVATDHTGWSPRGHFDVSSVFSTYIIVTLQYCIHACRKVTHCHWIFYVHYRYCLGG